MSKIYESILSLKKNNKKGLALLLDPDKIDLEKIELLCQKITQSPATHLFIGGSHVDNNVTEKLIIKLRENLNFGTQNELPIVLFPGNPNQISDQADAILFLSLISGRNPDYLIEHQVNAVPLLKKTNLEIISTGYILIENGKQTAVERISKTKPLSRENPDYILQTAQAGEMLGNKLIYLEAGSGANNPVPLEIIRLVAQNIDVPLIVGGGIRSKIAIENAHKSGADIVVIGTAFENNLDFFD